MQLFAYVDFMLQVTSDYDSVYQHSINKPKILG